MIEIKEISTDGAEDRTRVSNKALLAVLYADIVGSTRLYERFGDAVAQKAISGCLGLMTEVVERAGGRVVKSIGDEIECVFTDPVKAMLAGTDMQPAIAEAGKENRFETGPLRIKVGFHYGPVSREDDDLRGEAVTLAHEIIKLAKPDQVLTSGQTLDAVPGAMRLGARQVDQIPSPETGGPLDVFELIWEETGVTHESPYRPSRRSLGHKRLELNYGDRKFEMDESRPNLTVGRVAQHDVVVPTDYTSRLHAEMEFAHGRFRITDMSANGTLVIRDDGRVITLRREHLTLEGSGRICFGGTPEDNPDGVIKFRCI